MAASAQQHTYQCAQCGTSEIVALPVVYQQGTRSFSGLLNHGVSQSLSAQAVAPPEPRGYLRRLLPWGFGVILLTVTTFFEMSAYLHRSEHPASETLIALIFLLVWAGAVLGMLRSLSSIARYNREVYPKLHSDWAHTYMCRRCCNLSLIP